MAGFVAAIAVVASLNSSVGHAGAWGYLAVVLPTALTLSICFAAVGGFRCSRLW
jgi:hypothetical protein